MRIVVVTGMSGSGKSTALHALEDAGFYAVDNLPIALFEKLVELTQTSGQIRKLALVIDARDPASLRELPEALAAARQDGHDVELVFLDTTDAILSRRFSETRRRHPLSGSDSVQAGINAERKLLEPALAVATKTLDTSSFSSHELRRQVLHIANQAGSVVPMGVAILSFGFKHGLPSEADLLFDVRFLPNPYFVESLRRLSGEDEPCAAYVLERSETKTFLSKAQDLLEFLLPQYENEGKTYLTLALGCTGGQHRSVAIAIAIGKWLESKGRQVRVRHRDLVRAPRPPSISVPPL